MGFEEKENMEKHMICTMKDFLQSSHLEQMEFLMLSPDCLETAYAKKCWSDQFLRFLKTITSLSRIVFLQTLESNKLSQCRNEEDKANGEKPEEIEKEKKGDTPEKEKRSSSEMPSTKKGAEETMKTNLLVRDGNEKEADKILDGSDMGEETEKKGDTPEKKEKESFSKGVIKKEEDSSSAEKLDARVLKVLCHVLEEWETAKVMSYYGKPIADNSSITSFGKLNEKGITKEKANKFKVKLLKETPKEKTLTLKEVKEEPQEITSPSKPLQRSQSLKLKDSRPDPHGKPNEKECEKDMIPSTKTQTEEIPKKTSQSLMEALKAPVEITSCRKKQPEREIFNRIAEEKKHDVAYKKEKTETCKAKLEELIETNKSKLEDLQKRANKSEELIGTNKTKLEDLQKWVNKSEVTRDVIKPISRDIVQKSQPSPIYFTPTYTHIQESYTPPPAIVPKFATPYIQESYTPPPAPMPKIPAETPKVSAPSSGSVYVREHYRQGHHVQGHYRGNTWVEGYYRQGHTVSGHYRRK